MSDVNVRLCGYCSQKKVWFWSGLKLKDGSKVYTDGAKRRWAGRRCPDCERSRVHTAVHCDQFERQIIVDALAENGFAVAAPSLPLHAAKDGENFNFGIKRARVDRGAIVLESQIDGEPDMVVLVFETVRIFTRSHVASMLAAGKMTIAPQHPVDVGATTALASQNALGGKTPAGSEAEELASCQ